MKIHVRQIRPEGIELRQAFTVESIGLSEKDTLRFVVPVEVKAKITRVDNSIFAEMTASSCYQSFCGRCLEEVKKEWVTKFALTFEVAGREEFIEMDEDIRQEVILNLPERVLCQEDCRGLCLDCGANLNKEICRNKIET